MGEESDDVNGDGYNTQLELGQEPVPYSPSAQHLSTPRYPCGRHLRLT